MDTLFVVCAAFGGTILVVQTLLALVGVGGDDLDLPDADIDGGPGSADASSTDVFKLLSLKSVVAFLAFFGLAGMLGRALGSGSTVSVLLGLAAGVAAMYVIAGMMLAIARLQSSGNYDLQDALGAEGRVALRVPGSLGGRGRVAVDFEGRRVECDALTEGSEIPTGGAVRVVSVRGPRTVLVEPLV